METTQTLCRFGKLLTSLEASRAAAQEYVYVVSRCDSEYRVAVGLLARFARSTSGDGTVCDVKEAELEQMERTAARLADREAWQFMTDPGDFDSLLS